MPLSKKLTTVTPLSKNLALALFFTLPILGFVFGIEYQKVVTSESTNESNVQMSTQEIKKSQQIYQNTTWKFQLELPPSWNGYIVTEHNHTSNPNSDLTADVCFSFQREGSLPVCILQVSIFTEKQWQANLQKVGTQVQQLGTVDGYYFSSNEYNPLCVQLDEFQCERSKEIDEIVKTFKVIEK